MTRLHELFRELVLQDAEECLSGTLSDFAATADVAQLVDVVSIVAGFVIRTVFRGEIRDKERERFSKEFPVNGCRVERKRIEFVKEVLWDFRDVGNLFFGSKLEGSGRVLYPLADMRRIVMVIINKNRRVGAWPLFQCFRDTGQEMFPFIACPICEVVSASIAVWLLPDTMDGVSVIIQGIGGNIAELIGYDGLSFLVFDSGCMLIAYGLSIKVHALPCMMIAQPPIFKSECLCGVDRPSVREDGFIHFHLCKATDRMVGSCRLLREC